LQPEITAWQPWWVPLSWQRGRSFVDDATALVQQPNRNGQRGGRSLNLEHYGFVAVDGAGLRSAGTGLGRRRGGRRWRNAPFWRTRPLVDEARRRRSTTARSHAGAETKQN
jgi:hypothetical protein